MTLPVTRNRERGIALLMSIVALLLISAIVAGMVVLTNTESYTSANFKDEQLAFFSAKAGIEEARDRMRTDATNTLRTASLPTTLPGTTGSVLYILNPGTGETVAPWKGSTVSSFPDTEICKETTTISCTSSLPNLTTCNTWCASTTASGTYAATPKLAWKWVRVTLKQNNALTLYPTNGNASSAVKICWDGTKETTNCTSPNLPVYVLTTLAVTPSGSRRMIQTEIAEDRFSFTAPGALTLDGPGVTASMPNSNNYSVVGSDTAGCGAAATTATIPAIGVTTDADDTTVTNAIPNGRRNNYTGSGGTTPDVQNIASSLPSSMQTVSSLQALVTTLQTSVTQPIITGPASNLSSPGTSTAPQIIFVNGDLTLHGNVTGYGILVVTGTFEASGNVGWNGLVLVVGKGIFRGNGGGNSQYTGAVLVAHTLDNAGLPLSTLGAPTFDFNGGGGNGIYYSTGCISQATTLTTFHIMAFRELIS